MSITGFNNRVARVDLSSGKVEYEKLNKDDVRKYVGARGLGVKYVLDNGPEVEPFSPDNLLCFMTGPLSGTEVKMSGRMAVVTKSPLTGTVTDSHIGGWTAAKLKWAGLDGVLFTGKSDEPVYAYVEDGKVNAAGLVVLKERMPFADLSKFETNPVVQEFGEMLTVNDLCRYIESRVGAE